MPLQDTAHRAPLSAVASLIEAHSPHPAQSPHLHALALEVLHNLCHQHYWTSLRLHTHSPITHKPLPRPLISGLPPQRIYVHPDDQIEELKEGLKEGDVGVEKEWVLPTRLREKWSLRRFGDVFDGIKEEPWEKGEGVEVIDEKNYEGPNRAQAENEERDQSGERGKKVKTGKRRGGKRMLLATVGDDSTIVYYIMHDGIVKPRQN